MAIVYMATNLVNGKRYVGVTNKALKKRRQGHFTQAFSEKRRVKFHCALRKYGRDNFRWDVLAEYITWVDALAGEIYFIEKMKPEYNLTKGGEGIIGGISHNRRRVLCLEDNLVFESLSEAADHYDVCDATMHHAIQEKNNIRCRSRHFIYFTKYVSEKKRLKMIKKLRDAQVDGRKWKNRNPAWVAAQREAIRQRGALRKTRVKKLKKVMTPERKRQVELNWKIYAHLGPQSMARKVLCVDDDRVFESASSAARYYGVPKSAVIELCLGKNGRKTVGGKIFMYFVGKEKAA